MDLPGGRSVRSRTSSTSSLRSPRCPATPAHTPNTATLSRGGGGPLSATSSFPAFHNVNPDQLAAGLTRVRAEQGGSRSSSIPPTPAPTPNPLLQVNHHMVPEQLVAGIKNIRHDEGFDSMGYEWVTRLLKTGPWMHGLSSRSRTDNKTGLRRPD